MVTKEARSQPMLKPKTIMRMRSNEASYNDLTFLRTNDKVLRSVYTGARVVLSKNISKLSLSREHDKVESTHPVVRERVHAWARSASVNSRARRLVRVLRIVNELHAGVLHRDRKRLRANDLVSVTLDEILDLLLRTTSERLPWLRRLTLDVDDVGDDGDREQKGEECGVKGNHYVAKSS